MPEAVNGVEELSNLIPEVWSSDFYDELRNKLIFGNWFSREYEGEIKQQGDVVKVNQIVAPTGEILTNDKNKFTPEQMVVNQYSVTANKRAVASFKFTDLAQLQSMEFKAQAQEALTYSVMKQLESDIILALIAALPTLNITNASDMAAADIANMRRALSKAKVPRNDRLLALDVDYYNDLLTKNQIISSDYAEGRAFMDGEVRKVLGFTPVEHDLLTDDSGFGVHKSLLQLVMQQSLRLKISDTHVLGEFGYIMSVDFVFGHNVFEAARGIRIKETGAA